MWQDLGLSSPCFGICKTGSRELTMFLVRASGVSATDLGTSQGLLGALAPVTAIYGNLMT